MFAFSKTDEHMLKLGEDLEIDLAKVKEIQLDLRAITHDLRCETLKLLSESGELTVTDVYVKLRVEQSVASQHLAILRRAGFVKTRRDGKFIYYSVNKPAARKKIANINDWV